MIRTNVGTYWRQVGDVTVTALLDGQFEGKSSLILGPHDLRIHQVAVCGV